MLTGVSPWLVILATFGCGSAERPSGATAPGSGGTAGGGAAGSGGASGASSAGRGGAAAGGGASSAGTTSAGNAGMPNYPPGSIVLGPFDLNGGISGAGDDHDYDLSLPEHGHAWFRATGSARVGQVLPVTTGLVRPPASSSVGTNWLCPGKGATWTPTETDDATSDCGARCNYALLMPAASSLSCTGTSTSGTLAFSPAALVADATSTVTTTVAALNGVTYGIQRTTGPVTPPTDPAQRPARISYSERTTDGPPSRYVTILFTATPSASVASGQPVTKWDLSDVSVIYRANGSAGETKMLCATGGTYTMTASDPSEHAITLAGVSDEIACPGTELQSPVVIEFGR